MSASAAFMGILGIAASFFSHEVLALIGASVETQTVTIVQVLGALYLGFAFLNWYLRGSVIGGIYNRPLAFGNMLHFTVVAITLVKVALAYEQAALWAFTTVYLMFSVWFGTVLFSPAPVAPINKDLHQG
jgi:hypothetical protein